MVSGAKELEDVLATDAPRRSLWVRPRGAVWLSSAALIAASIVSLWPVLSREGWPINHEGHVWATRAGVLHAAWQRGEWFPLWWREGNLGLGSPMPALYHKLQNYVCTLLLSALGDIKRAQLASLILFTSAGCLGMRAVALHLGATRLGATLFAAALPFTSYAAADWLVRGAFAEHAAFMLLPWFLLVLLRWVRTGAPAPYQLAAVLILLFYAHSMTALYAGLLVLVALLLALIRHRAQARRILSGALLSGALLALAVSPAVWLTRVLTPHIYFAHATTGYYVVHRHLTSLVNAMFVGEAPIVGFRVAPDNALWVALAISGALVGYARARRREPARAPYAELLLLATATLLMIFLRLEPAARVYDWVPGLRFIQFPWRLLSFTTVLLLALCAYFAARLRPLVQPGIAGGLLVALFTTGHVMRYHEPIWMEAAKVGAAVDPKTYIRWMEYLPAVPGPATVPQLRAWARGPRSVGDQCKIERRAEHSFFAQCQAPGVVALPFSFSGLEVVTISGRAVRARRTPKDPRVRVEVPAGASEVAYEPPSWRALLRF